MFLQLKKCSLLGFLGALLLLDTFGEGVEELLVDTLVEIGAVGHGPQIGTPLSVKNAGKPLTFRTSATGATLHHATTGHHVVVQGRHLQQMIQEVVKGITLPVLLCAQVVSTSHLRHHVPSESETQSLSNVLPLAQFLLDRGYQVPCRR